MGVFDFVANAGSKLFGIGDANAGEALGNHINSNGGVDLSKLSIDVEDDCATLSGCVATQEEKEKAVLVAGNVEGITKVVDNIVVGDGESSSDQSDWQSTTYTVKSGDSLSKIAKEVYGDFQAYPKIFEANRPMLEHPDKIYPGQVLRIPK